MVPLPRDRGRVVWWNISLSGRSWIFTWSRLAESREQRLTKQIDELGHQFTPSQVLEQYRQGAFCWSLLYISPTEGFYCDQALSLTQGAIVKLSERPKRPSPSDFGVGSAHRIVCRQIGTIKKWVLIYVIFYLNKREKLSKILSILAYWNWWLIIHHRLNQIFFFNLTSRNQILSSHKTCHYWGILLPDICLLN